MCSFSLEFVTALIFPNANMKTAWTHDTPLWYCHAVLSSIDVDKANNPNDPRPIKGKTLHQEEQYSQRVASFVQYIFALIDVL